MKLLLTRHLPEEIEDRAVREFQARLNPSDQPFDASSLAAAAEGCEALLVCSTDNLSAEVIDALPSSVRVVATFSVGYDHIDLTAAQRRGIMVANTPDVVTTSTAEVAFLLLLGTAHRAIEGDQMVRTDTWPGWAPMQLLGRLLSGKNLGIVGMGRIGQAVAQRARSFDMSILYHNRHRLPPVTEQGAAYYDRLDDMLPQCHFLSLHCPLTPQTHHLLNAERLHQLSPGATVINTARGGLIDDAALIDALQSGHLAAAGLDVFDGEPAIHPGYRDLPNVFLMPHLGTAAYETRVSMGMRALDNISAVLAGGEPPDRVV
jgi:lactate dehydrogenase-like 2-hydroxyacid dehydrogenase